MYFHLRYSVCMLAPHNAKTHSRGDSSKCSVARASVAVSKRVEGGFMESNRANSDMGVIYKSESEKLLKHLRGAFYVERCIDEECTESPYCIYDRQTLWRLEAKTNSRVDIENPCRSISNVLDSNHIVSPRKAMAL